MAKSKSISNAINENEVKPIVFDVALTDEQMRYAEEAAQSWGVTRRIAFAYLTRSSQQLLDSLRKGEEELAEGMLDTLENLNKFLKWQKSETELLEAAQARLILVLQQYSDETVTQ